jgi:hypothetical protein
MATTTLSANGKRVGFAQTSIPSAYYGWLQISGAKVLVNLAANARPNVPLYTTATSGVLDDATVSGGLIIGAIATNTISNATAVTLLIARGCVHRDGCNAQLMEALRKIDYRETEASLPPPPDARENILASLARGLPEFQPAHCPHDGTIVVCGSGPSLPSFIEDIRAEREKRRPIFAVKGAHDLLVKNGIEPNVFVSCRSQAAP